MKFPPTFITTPAIQSLCYQLDVLKSAWHMQSVPQTTLSFIRQKTLLQSSLYSARIEGNPTSEHDLNVGLEPEQRIHKTEIENLYAAYSNLPNYTGKPLTVDLIKQFHAQILKDISDSPGHFRSEQSAIFNQAGVAVYIPPPPQYINDLVIGLVDWCNSSVDHVGIKISVAHIWFEKIHPFLDGNGRVGRLVSSFLLLSSGYDFGGIVPFEKYLDEHREDYYDALMKDTQDVSVFIEFFLSAIISQAHVSIDEVKHPPVLKYPTLLPRRAELVEIINDHKLVTFDFLARRFRAVSSRSLHYDLEYLVKHGYIFKRGTTRGAVYIPIS